MNRKSLLIFVVVLTLLMAFSGVFAKGGLKDNNAYSDYMGMTQDTVSRFAPKFEEWYENYYVVDYRDYGGNDCLALAVEFDSQGTVDAVDILITAGAVDELKDSSVQEAAGYGLLDVGMKIVELLVDSYTDSLDSDNLGDSVKGLLIDAASQGANHLVSSAKKNKVLTDATNIGLGYLGISSEQIMDAENKNGNRMVIRLVSGDYIIAEKAESDLYIISAIRG